MQSESVSDDFSYPTVSRSLEQFAAAIEVHHNGPISPVSDYRMKFLLSILLLAFMSWIISRVLVKPKTPSTSEGLRGRTVEFWSSFVRFAS